MYKPLKRVKALEELSRDHHHGLLLSWKIRKGLKQKIALERIKKYTDWFWKNNLEAHFEFEEKFIFPILETDHKLIKKALREHSRLKRLFTASDKLEQNLSLIEEELVAHIRFEERTLFQEIQQLASETQLKMIEAEHSKKIVEEWEDQFWL
jgi:iron-sulfur cluster repair protein YtfE (RIC family)